MVKDPSERKEQIAIVTALRKRGHYVFSVPNGFQSSAGVKAMFKKEGLLPGHPDFGICIKGGKVVWVEMKTKKKGRLSDQQKLVHSHLEALGHTVIVGYGAKDAWNKLIEIGI